MFGEGNQRVVGAPVVFQTSTGSFTPFAPVLTNDNGEATARLSTNEAATARARVDTHESDAVNIGVEAPDFDDCRRHAVSVLKWASPSR